MNQNEESELGFKIQFRSVTGTEDCLAEVVYPFMISWPSVVLMSNCPVVYLCALGVV